MVNKALAKSSGTGLEMAKSSKHQSKLLVLAKGELASFLVEWYCDRYTQAQGSLGYEGVERFEGGDGGPLAKAVDVFLEGNAFAQTEVVVWVSHVVCPGVSHGVSHGDGVFARREGDTSAVTYGRSCCHRHDKNLRSDV